MFTKDLYICLFVTQLMYLNRNILDCCKTWETKCVTLLPLRDLILFSDHVSFATDTTQLALQKKRIEKHISVSYHQKLVFVNQSNSMISDFYFAFESKMIKG